jgi:glucoamylase
MPAGRALRVTARVPAIIHWSMDGWRTWQDTELGDSGLDLYLTDLPTEQLPRGSSVVFTFYWPEAARWENADFEVSVE